MARRLATTADVSNSFHTTARSTVRVPNRPHNDTLPSRRGHQPSPITRLQSARCTDPRREPWVPFRNLRPQPLMCSDANGAFRESNGEAQEENPMREQVLSCDLLTVGSCSSFGLSKRNDQWCRLENSTDHNKLACCGASFADCCNPNPAGIAVAVVLCVAMTTILVGLAVALQRRRSRSGGAAARQQCQWYNQCRRRGRESE
jgi:hypothetical protein